MDINFYNGEMGKVLGILAASPEEFQTYAAPLVEVPEGCVLTVRTRMVKGRQEILIGAAPVGKPLRFHGDDDPKPLPAPKPPTALEIPHNVKLATDANLEVMAARNGVNVTEAWRKRARTLREADVAKAMKEKKGEAVTA